MNNLNSILLILVMIVTSACCNCPVEEVRSPIGVVKDKYEQTIHHRRTVYNHYSHSHTFYIAPITHYKIVIEEDSSNTKIITVDVSEKEYKSIRIKDTIYKNTFIKKHTNKCKYNKNK